MKHGRILAVMAALLLAFAACGPAATPTKAAGPTATALPAATATPTVAPASPTAPAASPTPKPTAIQAPSEAKPKYGGTLRTSLATEPSAWDPFKLPESGLQDTVNFLHDRLMNAASGPPACALSPLVGGVAESWRWLDEKTLEIKLKAGVRFQNLPPMNGRELTAQDVVFSITTQWPRQSWLAAVTKEIDTAEAVDRYTVRLKIKRIYVPFLERLLPEHRSYIVGPEMYGGRKEITLPQENVGLGPFTFKAWTPGVRVDMGRNDGYFIKGLPYVDGVTIYVIPETSTRTSALRSGRLDIAWFPVAQAAAELRSTAPHLQSQGCPFPGTTLVYMRTDQPPYNDVRVRRALNMALDKEAMNKLVRLGLGMQWYGSVAPFFPDFFMALADYPPEVRRYLEYDPAEAKKLLAEAGYPKGFKTTIVATAMQHPDTKQYAEFMAAAFENIGITSELKILDYPQYVDITYASKFTDLAVGFGVSGPSVDEEVYDNFHSASTVRNRSRVKDPELDRLIDQFQVAQDPAAQKRIVREIQVRVASQMYHLPVPMRVVTTFWQPNLMGVNSKSSTGIQATWLRDVWFK